MNDSQQTQPAYYPPGYVPRPVSPVADLIRNHRDQMRVIWDLHARELRDAQEGVRAA